MKLFLIVMFFSFSSFGMTALSGYPESIYAIGGYQIDTSVNFKRGIEIVYAPAQKLYGVTFYNSNTKEDKSTIPTGTFSARACGLSARGVVSGIDLLMKAKDFEVYEKIFNCESPIFFRIMNEDGDMATYRISEKEDDS